ncbi:MAG: phosphatase PAP2 family protein [Actinomycetota bacterium]
MSDERRERRYLMTSIVAIALLALTYVVFVRTEWGQRVDDVAFDGREVEDPAVTQALNELLHSITQTSLFLLTAAIVTIALARRRWRLALVVGTTIVGAVVTTEVLKTRVLDRPRFDGVAGLEENWFPSGHATIGISLALGSVMVAPHARRWLITVAAAALSAVFGIGVVAAGWHRPSDVIGAYLVAVAWFAASTAILLRWRGSGTEEMGTVEARLSKEPVAVATALAVIAAILALFQTFTADGLRTVEYAAAYLAAGVVIVTMGIGLVVGYALSLRGASLDPQ